MRRIREEKTDERKVKMRRVSQDDQQDEEGKRGRFRCGFPHNGWSRLSSSAGQPETE